MSRSIKVPDFVQSVKCHSMSTPFKRPYPKKKKLATNVICIRERERIRSVSVKGMEGKEDKVMKITPK